ncbi:MAG: M56 family metallopeptidase [Bryobacteraceae bacterium]|jgi:beta-lactamase regulating signal transducer with metallopeptidase domain
MNEFAASFGRLAGNHLWQSTGFAAVAVLLALALRANHARVRYWLWMAASVKFLVPFSALAAVGSYLGRWLVPATPVARVPLVMEQIVQPFAPAQVGVLPVAPSVAAPGFAYLLPGLLLAIWVCGFAVAVVYGWTRWRRVAAVVRASAPLRDGREMEALRRVAERRLPTGAQLAKLPHIDLVSSTARLEPGIFGIFRPVLWLPVGIGDHLGDAS